MSMRGEFTLRRRAGFVSTAIILLAAGLLASLGALVVMYRQGVEARAQTAELKGQVRSLVQGQRASRKALTEVTGLASRLQGDVSQTGDDVEALLEAVGDLDSTVKQQAEKTMDAAEVSANTVPSVVIVECDGAAGSGFAVASPTSTPDSTAVVTNRHVVEECVDGDGWIVARRASTIYTARLVTEDAEHDLALLEVDADLPPLRVADSPSRGDEVVAVGSPLGYEETVTVGVISNMTKDLFQTDAGLNPGNSGGPLMDRHGRVLGVNTSTARDQEPDVSIEGISFAVRMSVVCRTVIRCRTS